MTPCRPFLHFSKGYYILRYMKQNMTVVEILIIRHNSQSYSRVYYTTEFYYKRLSSPQNNEVNREFVLPHTFWHLRLSYPYVYLEINIVVHYAVFVKLTHCVMVFFFFFPSQEEDYTVIQICSAWIKTLCCCIYACQAWHECNFMSFEWLLWGKDSFEIS